MDLFLHFHAESISELKKLFKSDIIFITPKHLSAEFADYHENLKFEEHVVFTFCLFIAFLRLTKCIR